MKRVRVAQWSIIYVSPAAPSTAGVRMLSNIAVFAEAGGEKRVPCC